MIDMTQIEAAAASSGCPVEELTMPSREPWLSRWCRLHTLHLAALAVDPPRGAARLADLKLGVYVEERRAVLAARLPELEAAFARRGR